MKKIIEYYQLYDIYQRIKTSRYRFYDKLEFLFISFKSWKEIFINFVIKLSFNKYKSVVYNAILVIINRYIKIIKYLFVFIIIDVVALTELFFVEIVCRYDIFYNIVNDRDFMFINVFWFILCFYSRIKRRLNIAFHS